MDSNATVRRTQQLSEENRRDVTNAAGAREEGRRILPSITLFSQALTTADAVEADPKHDDGAQECTKARMEEIVKELRIVRRQNKVTHWLLAVLIMVTAAWQLSEVSILMMMKSTLENPFKAVWNLLRGSFRGGPSESDSGKSSSSSNHNNMEGLTLKPLKMLDLHHIGIPSLTRNGSDGDDEDDDD
ncbi:hypothetical protein ACLOJK_002065 [Asimina triloba]